MIGRIILLCILIGLRLGYGLVEPLINKLHTTQSSASYVLINSLSYVDKVWFGIFLILLFLVVMDLYRYFHK